MPETVSATLSVSVPLHILALRPEAPTEGPPPVLIGLHGYAMNAVEMLPLLSAFAPPGFLVVSVQGPHTTLVPGTEGGPERKLGFHWGVSPRPEENRAVHRDAVDAAVRWAIGQGGDPQRISLAGFSQPCSFNYRVAMEPPDGRPFRGVVGICGGIPGEWKEDDSGTDVSRATAVLHVSTRGDAFYSQERVAPFRARLQARFGPVTHSLYDGGHRIPSAAGGEMRAFLAAHG